MTAHCLHCGHKTETNNPKEVVWKNGMKAMQGTCADCGTKVSKIVGKA